MNELAISIRNYTKDTYRDIINKIKLAGFKNVFIEWYNDDTVLQNNILNYVRKVGLNVIFVHLGYQNTSVLWAQGREGEQEVLRYINDIDICQKNGIDLVIIHPTKDFEIPVSKDIGLKRIRSIVEYAASKNVKVAFENVELKGYLEYIIDNIKSSNLGICFDVGHCNLFFDGNIDIELFKNKVFAVHLHDNYKLEDNHYLIFDGTVNWDKVVKQMLSLNYNGYVTLECGYCDYYSNISIEQYYRLAYERGKRLINLITHYKKISKGDNNEIV